MQNTYDYIDTLIDRDYEDRAPEYASLADELEDEAASADSERELRAWQKYGGCTCMGHGECNFCKER